MSVIPPYIPQFITVHLGRPEANAQDVTVSFTEYIKNVASSEIYPTWPDSALRANIYAQISFALNKIYTEYYRSRGYDFDITNSTSIDQAFVPGRNIFENISRLVDELFDTYIRRQGYLEPFPAEFCNGTTVTCPGLSQWGTVDLANQGRTPYEILTYYYGEDIDLVGDTPVRGVQESFPGYPLEVGSRGNPVRTVQVELNRISQNYPAIPKINPVDGIFGSQTERSVRTFQEIFDLAPTGIVDKATWYKLVYLYVGIKRLNELNSEGQALAGISLEYPDAIQLGNTGENVVVLQYLLATVADFYLTVPSVRIDGIFGQETLQAVKGFQQTFGLRETGLVDAETWGVLVDAFLGIERELVELNQAGTIQTEPFPGETLRVGSRGESVRTLQQYLNYISLTYQNIPPVAVTGIFGSYTRYSVTAFQNQFGLPATGEVDEATWNSIASVYQDVLAATMPSLRQYPGYPLSEGSVDQEQAM